MIAFLCVGPTGDGFAREVGGDVLGKEEGEES